MKRKNVILCVGILSMAMLGGCGGTTPEENSTANIQEVEETTEIEETEVEETTETEEVTEAEEETTEVEEITEAEEEIEVEETTADAQTELSAVMTEIYKVSTASASAETVAENFKNYAFKNGAPSSSSAFESMATEWFQTMQDTEGKDIRAEFSKAFNTVTTTAQSKDETLEYDVAYLNVVNGILAAIGEIQEEKTETNTGEENEFSTIMTEIYKVNTDSASVETVAENFKNYALKNGAPSSSSAFESMATEWFQTMQDTEGKDIRAEFSDAFNTVTTTAQSKDETLEFDAAYLNVVNGIFSAIGQ